MDVVRRLLEHKTMRLTWTTTAIGRGAPRSFEHRKISVIRH
jgi:hypothetical protein